MFLFFIGWFKMDKMKKLFYIKEPFGLPFELTEKDKFKKNN